MANRERREKCMVADFGLWEGGLMKVEIQKTVIIKMTTNEAEKISDAIAGLSQFGDKIPDWAKDKLEELHDLIVNSI